MKKPETTSTVILKKSRELPFLHRHPWVFSGAIGRIQGKPADGDVVSVRTEDGKFIGHGLYNGQSNIRVRLYGFLESEIPGEEFWKEKMMQAIALRRDVLNLVTSESACRIINSEGDGLSGLTVDKYGDWLSVQFTSFGLFTRKESILAMLRDALHPKGIVLRTEKGILEAEGIKVSDGVLWGGTPPSPVIIDEQGLRVQVDLLIGQKTGFYLDQRDNRRAAAAYAKSRRCLDLFCYTGGFSLSLARAGASSVTGIDSSEAALNHAKENVALNGLTHVEFEKADVFEKLKKLKEAQEKFDLIVLDPPRFAHSRAGLSQALKGYQTLNRFAVELLSPGGILVSCSCSGRVSREMFEEGLSTVSRQSGRSIQILERRGPAVDHPVDLACPESDYLKCYICRVF